jgi:hypothetical protein
MAATLLPPPTAGLALLKSSNPEVRLLKVHETEDALEITGRVSCYYLKQLAQETVRGAAAGRRIVNRVVVTRSEMVGPPSSFTPWPSGS